MIQIDMRMPNNCINCNLSHDYVCMVTEKYLDEDLCGAYGETRPDCCPLKEQETEKKCCKDCEYYGNCHDI